MPASTSSALFSSLKVGAFRLEHRVVMPAMTRHRADPRYGVPSELMSQYYAQRATIGGLLIAEPSQLCPQAHLDGREPGLYTPEQVNAWRGVTGAVHRRGGIMVAQLGNPAPGALERQDLDTALRQIRDAAEAAGDAGFDGIEVCSTWPETFARRQRADSSERSELLVDLLQTLAGVWSTDRIGLNLTAVTPGGLQRDSDAWRALGDAAGVAVRIGLAFVHVNMPWPVETGVAPAWLIDSLTVLRPKTRVASGVLIASGGLTLRTASALLEEGLAQAAGFGRHFITNPDLPRRLRYGAPLTEWSDAFLGNTGERHYADFPPSNVFTGEPGWDIKTSEGHRCDADPGSLDPP